MLKRAFVRIYLPRTTKAVAGLHLVAWCNGKLADQPLAHAAWQAGVEVAPLSTYAMRTPTRHGLVLGYGMLTPTEIRTGVDKLAAAFKLVG